MSEYGRGMEDSQRRVITLSFNVEILFITKCVKMLYFSNFKVNGSWTWLHGVHYEESEDEETEQLRREGKEIQTQLLGRLLDLCPQNILHPPHILWGSPFSKGCNQGNVLRQRNTFSLPCMFLYLRGLLGRLLT